jgi:hypothetical protein
LKGFDPTRTHSTDDEKFVGYHLQRVKEGHYDSARWLREYVRRAEQAGQSVDVYVRHVVELLWNPKLRHLLPRPVGAAPGRSLRRSMQKKDQRGKRGPGLGAHRQLLLAREAWKNHNVGEMPLKEAAYRVGKQFKTKTHTVINSYHRFQREMPRALYIELARDYHDDPANWLSLAWGDTEILEAAINKLTTQKAPRLIR